MPRRKKIDLDKQKLKDIKNKIIEEKNCTAAELVFLHSFREEECEIIRKSFRFIVTEKTIKVPKFKNSWKGLIFCLLSLVHLKYGEKITGEIVGMPKGWLLASEDYNFVYGCETYYGNTVEILPKIIGYQRCFVRCNMTSENIERCIRGLAEILGIDEKASIVMTEFTEGTHSYTSKIVDFPHLELKPRILDADNILEMFQLSKEMRKKKEEDFIELQKNEHRRKLYEYLEEAKL